MRSRLCGGGPCDYCVSPSPKILGFEFLRHGLDLGSGFGPVGTGDWGLGLGLVKLSCFSYYRPFRPCSETPAPDFSNPAVSEYQMSGPRLSLLTMIIAADPVSPLRLSPVPPASPTLTSTDRVSHHTPDQVTRLRHTWLLPARRILRKNANKLADLHLVSPHELSHQSPAITCCVWLCFWSCNSLEPTTTLLDNDISSTHVHDI